MPSTHSKHYKRLFAMIAFHFVAMYILMYAMVDTIANCITASDLVRSELG